MKLSKLLGSILLIIATFSANASIEKAKEAYARNDFKTVFKEAMEDAKKGNILAETIVAKLYKEGTGVTQNYAEARKWYAIAAKEGSIDAQNMLGNMYYTGKDKKDFKEAFTYYMMAAAQGDPAGQINVAKMYEKGEFVKQNYETAFKYKKLAAAQNFAEGQYQVGVVYLAGEGVKQDLKEAAKWFKLAAAQGHMEAKKAMKYVVTGK